MASVAEALKPELILEDVAASWRARGAELSQTFKRHQWQVADWINDGVTLLYPDNNSTEITEMETALAALQSDHYRPGTPAPVSKYGTDKAEFDNRLRTAKNKVSCARYQATLVYDVAEELFPQYSRTTLRTLAHVGRSFPAYMRIYANLTFSHYMAALVLSHDKRDEWLSKANSAKPKWSVARLRAEIYSALELPATEPESLVTVDIQPTQRKPTKWMLPLSDPSKEKLKELALARRVDPAILAARIVDEYLAEYSDEIQGKQDLDRKNAESRRRFAPRPRAIACANTQPDGEEDFLDAPGLP